MSTSKELVELTELYKNIQLQELGPTKDLVGTSQEKSDKKNQKKDNKKLPGEFPGSKDEFNKKYGITDDNNDDKEIKGPNININKSNNKSKTFHATDRSGRDFDDQDADPDVRGGSKERLPIKQDIKNPKGEVVGHRKVYPASPDYQQTFENPKKVNVSAMPSEFTKGREKEIAKANNPDPVKEVKPETYLGKEQGLLNKADWLKKTANSPAAKSGAFSDDQRWAQQLKHRQWQKDNNRGKFKVKKVKTTKVEVPSKFAANKDKPTFQRRDQKLLDKGLKPPTYTTKVDVPKVETPKVETPKVETPKVDKKKTFQNKITAESFAGKVLAKGTGELAKRVAKKMAGSKAGTDKAPQDAPKAKTPQDAPSAPSAPSKPAPSAPDKAPAPSAPSAPDKAPNAPSRPKPSTGPSGGESQRKKTKTGKAQTATQDAPKAERAQKEKDASKQQESYDAYDLVLDYIIETNQASSIEEANYIMMEMDQNTIHEIVQAQKKTLAEGIKTAVGLGMLALPYAMSQLEKRWNPVKNKRKEYQNKKATEYEKKSGTTKEDGYFR